MCAHNLLRCAHNHQVLAATGTVFRVIEYRGTLLIRNQESDAMVFRVIEYRGASLIRCLESGAGGDGHGGHRRPPRHARRRPALTPTGCELAPEGYELILCYELIPRAL